jgi:DNA-binding transcriptional LysR family regulator
MRMSSSRVKCKKLIRANEADLEFEPIMQDPFVVACRRDHLLAARESIGWAELCEHDYITLAQGSGNRLLIDQAVARSRSVPRWFCEVHHVPALVSLVEAGVGIGVVPRLAMPPAGHLSLVTVRLVEPEIARSLGIIKRRGRALSAAARLFHDLLTHAERKSATG